MGKADKRTFKAALFDLDGTLCDTEPYYVEFWDKMGAKYRPDLEHVGKLAQGIPPKSNIELYFKGFQEVLYPQLYALEATIPYSWMPGALEFIRDIRAHDVKCALVTSSNHYKMSCVAKVLPGFEDIFDHVLTMEQFLHPKPAPDCYLLGASAFGLGTCECVVFEDAFSGLKAGMDAGIFTVALASSNTREALLGRCDAVLDSFVGASFKTIADAIQSKLF